MSESATGLPGPVLHASEGRLYRFDPGALRLELLPAGDHGRYPRYEVLPTPADLVRWVGRAGCDTGRISR
ncbi:hypothetical protein ACWD7C_21025 [Streptomyces sp. NPDC005134]|uniref:hypothetical protein n=1 Tax=unclassified Streptomyces TaxID=2593676 RepID=UPI0033B57D77